MHTSFSREEALRMKELIRPRGRIQVIGEGVACIVVSCHWPSLCHVIVTRLSCGNTQTWTCSVNRIGLVRVQVAPTRHIPDLFWVWTQEALLHVKMHQTSKF